MKVRSRERQEGKEAREEERKEGGTGKEDRGREGEERKVGREKDEFKNIMFAVWNENFKHQLNQSSVSRQQISECVLE